MRPVKEEFYTVPNGGQPVKTLAEWQFVAVFSKLSGWKDNKAQELSAEAFNGLVKEVIAARADLVEILSQTEKGRPRGSKTKKKAVVAVVPETKPAA